MTKLNLNLLPSQAKFQAKKIRLMKMARRYMWIFVSVWVVTVLVVLGVSTLVNMMVFKERTKLTKIEAEVKSLNDRALTGWKLKYIAGMVAKAMSSRFEYGKTFDLVNGLFQDKKDGDESQLVSGLLSGDMGIKDMELKDNHTFLVSGQTANKEAIDTLEKKMMELERGDVAGFSGGKFISLGYSKGQWGYSLELKLE